MFLVNRFAEAIDITAAGTSAPIAMAAKAKPSNHDGKYFRNRSGTANVLSVVLILAVIVMKPSRARNPSISVYAGRIAMLRRTTSCERALSVPVITCGYMNSASADPSASVRYAVCAGALPGINAAGVPAGGVFFGTARFAGVEKGPEPARFRRG